MNIEVLLTPAEIAGLPRRDLSGVTCVVFDVLRATSTILTALAAGRARAVYPAATIEEARELHARNPRALLGGERGGRRIENFDLGNSPLEYTDPAAVGGRDVLMTTTNGTGALRACAAARSRRILVGALLNVRALGEYLRAAAPDRLLVVCAGSGAAFSFEDAIGAGILLDELKSSAPPSDAARIVAAAYAGARNRLLAALQETDNGRRLVGLGLGGDIDWCAQVSIFPLLAALNPADGAIRAIHAPHQAVAQNTGR